MPLDAAHESVISNGQRAMHLQRVNIAVQVSDLAATSSAFFDATAEVGSDAELETLIPELQRFAQLIVSLKGTPPAARRYRALIPAEVWQKGTAQLDDLSALDTDISSALAAVEAKTADPTILRALAQRLGRLSEAFSNLGRTEYELLVDQSTVGA